eukprot:gene4285-14395_t
MVNRVRGQSAGRVGGDVGLLNRVRKVGGDVDSGRVESTGRELKVDAADVGNFEFDAFMHALAQGIVRVAVVGDEGTGKTSLISTAANDTFHSRPALVLPPTRLPPEFSLEHTPMLITDTSSRPEDVPVADLVIQQSDVVVVCFDSRRHSTLDTIRTLWYPRIQQLKPGVPIIIACCKSDRLTEERETSQLREVFVTSGWGLDKRLRPLCAKALKPLSDEELNPFQLVCYNIALTDDELQNIKQMVLASVPSGVCARGLTLEGFLFLHVLFIERGCLESTWAVLRTFGYNEDLLLSDAVLDRVQWALPADQVYELSQVALDFLSSQFSMYDEDADGLISWQQLESMFSTIPPPIWTSDAWSRLLVPGTFGASHRHDAFLLKWRFSCMHDPRLAFTSVSPPRGFTALGQEPPHKEKVNIGVIRLRPSRSWQVCPGQHWCDTSTAQQELASLPWSTLVCYVFGPAGAGKSALVRALATQQISDGEQDGDVDFVRTGSASGAP